MALLKRIVKTVFFLPFSLIKNQLFVWRFLNRESVKLQKEKPLPLSELQKGIVDALNTDGIYITDIDTLFPGENLLPKLQEYAKSLESGAKVSEKKSFFIDYWNHEYFTLDFKNSFLSFTLNDTVLGVVNEYFGMYSRLLALRLMRTATVEKGSFPLESQAWHRDSGNQKYVKVFLYLNDVLDEETGPFYFVKGSQRGGKWESYFPQVIPYSSRKRRMLDEELYQTIPKEDVVMCTGKAGTMIFVDTVGIHKGGYSTKGSRLTSLAAFVTKNTTTPRKKVDRYIYPDDFEERLGELSPQVQFSVKKM